MKLSHVRMRRLVAMWARSALTLVVASAVASHTSDAAPALAAAHAVAPPAAVDRSERLLDLDLIVHAPANTPGDAILYIAGNHPLLGPWDPARHMLRHDKATGTWQTTLALPEGFTLQYKVTRGSWATVEKGPQGQEITNRTATMREDLVLNITVADWADLVEGAGPPRVSSLTGDIRTHEKFASKIFDNERRVLVYLPPMYEQEPQRRFPVLYMHDGQNLFDRATSTFGVEWEADETAERLIRSGRVEPLIIVGIYTNVNRSAELGDITPREEDDAEDDVAAGGSKYLRFLVEEVKPWIDRTYRTKPDLAHTGVGGSSLGGIMSLHAMQQYPDVFSRCASVSPALMWRNELLTKHWRTHREQLPVHDVRLWIDVGTAEIVGDTAATAYVDAVKRLVAVIEEGGLPQGERFRFVIDEGAAHNEEPWARRFPDMLEFLFPAADTAGESAADPDAAP